MSTTRLPSSRPGPSPRPISSATSGSRPSRTSPCPSPKAASSPSRGLGFGQIDPPQPPRRAGYAERRDDRGRRGPRLGHGPGGAGPVPEVRGRHDLPVLQPRRGPDRPRERRAAPRLRGRRQEGAGSAGPPSSSTRSGSPIGPTTGPPSSREGSSSGWPWPGPWPTVPGSSSPTSRRGTSTAGPRGRSSACSPGSTARRNLTVIMVSHEESLVREYAHEIVRLADGRVVATESPA